MEHEERITNLEHRLEGLTKTLSSTVLDVERIGAVVANFGHGMELVNRNVAKLEEDHQRMRATLHEQTGILAASGLKLGEILTVNTQQTPILEQLQRVVMGDDGVRDRVRDYGKRFKIWDRILIAVALGVATVFGGWIATKLTSGDYRLQRIEQKVDAKP